MPHEFGLRLALIGFATTTLQALWTGTAFQPALGAALGALAVCYMLGCVCGELARRLVDEAVERELALRGSPAAVAPPEQRTSPKRI